MRGIGPDPVRTDCTNAKAELAKYHWTYMNKDWGTQILDKWASQGCRPEVDRRLGYRLSLTAASLPTSLPRGTTLPGAGLPEQHRLGRPDLQPARAARTT